IDRLTTERFATPSLLLMEAAAAASARAITARFPEGFAGRRVRILCGRGNNGGDGAALARSLSLIGARVDVVLFGRVEETKGDARANFEMARRLSSFEAGSHTEPPPLNFIECQSIAEWEEIAAHSYDVIVDALFGTGLTRPLEGVHRQAVEHLELLRSARERANADRPLFASLDIPSGLDADSAALTGAAVRADLTVTFTAPKPANVLPPASHYNGELVVAHIGSPPSLLETTTGQAGLFLTEEADARAWLVRTRYAPDSYKNTHGHALVVAGSRGLTGAAVLCGQAAMRAGTGLVTIATPAAAQPAIAAQAMPEIMTAALPETADGAVSFEAIERVADLVARASVVAVGPGLSNEDESTRRFVRELIERRSTAVVIDADGLNALAPWPKDLRGSRELPLVLTPHLGEMQRLLGTEDKAALADRVEAARAFATAQEVLLVLKGSRTLIASSDGRVFVNPTGNAGLGTAGAGDTLTGIITGFLAQSYGTLKRDADALEAVIAAVYVGGLAGDIAARQHGKRALVASDISMSLDAAFRSLDAQGERP
ncbi:MAG TPA: NAD(P)H-hydrate dehydratase, partial [Pyrinomonadaceae bacterium]|nr:NAD(P)H-hydrate dehydratase [Pyrinomonadaceae bacterium]